MAKSGLQARVQAPHIYPISSGSSTHLCQTAYMCILTCGEVGHKRGKSQGWDLAKSEKETISKNSHAWKHLGSNAEDPHLASTALLSPTFTLSFGVASKQGGRMADELTWAVVTPWRESLSWRLPALQESPEHQRITGYFCSQLLPKDASGSAVGR